MCAQTSCDFVLNRVVKKVNVRKRVAPELPIVFKMLIIIKTLF
jgi:hypothetical protein